MRQTTILLLSITGGLLLIAAFAVAGAWGLFRLTQEAAQADIARLKEAVERDRMLEMQREEQVPFDREEIPQDAVHFGPVFVEDWPDIKPKLSPDDYQKLGPSKSRAFRGIRWTFILQRDDPEHFLRKLTSFKVLLLLPDGEQKETFKLCNDLEKRPLDFKRVDRNEINAHNRLWFISNGKQDCEFIAKELGLKDAPRWIAIFIPQELEVALLREELRYKNLSEHELNVQKWITTFDVDRRGDAWDISVRYQGPRKQ